MRWLRSPTGCTSRSSGRRRPLETPWGGEVGTVAVARPEPWRRWRSDTEPRREWGRVGGGIEEAGGCWRSYPPVVAGERVRRGRAPVPTRVGGTEKGGGRGRRAGSAGWARRQGLWLAGPFGPGGRGVSSFSLSFFMFCFI